MEFFLIICQNWDFLKSYIESLLFVGRGGMNPRASYKPGMCYTVGYVLQPQYFYLSVIHESFIVYINNKWLGEYFKPL